MTPAPAIATQSKEAAWHAGSHKVTLARLNGAATSLPSAEAARHLAEHGPNKLKEGKSISPLAIFLGQFKSLLVWTLWTQHRLTRREGVILLVAYAAYITIVVVLAVLGYQTVAL